MPTKRKKNNWQHPLYKTGYVKNRDGNCQLVINHNAKQFRKSIPLAFTVQNKDIALSLLEEFIMQIVYNRTIKIDTLKDIFEKFLEYKKDTLKPASIKKYVQAFNSFLNDSISTQDDIQRLILDNMIKSKLSLSSKNKQLTLLKGFFNFCIENNYITTNPITKSITPKFKAKDIEFYSDKELAKIIDYFETTNKKIAYLTKLINNTGLRITEAVSLSKDNINENGITIVGKGDHLRHIPSNITEELPALLQSFEPFNWKTINYPQRRLGIACEILNLPNLGFHSIRKSFENRLIQKDIPSDIVAEILGHTPEVQRKHYKKASKMKQLYDRIDKYNKK